MEDFLNGDLFIGYDHLYDAVRDWENLNSSEETTMNVVLFLRAALQILLHTKWKTWNYWRCIEPEQIEKILSPHAMIQGEE